MICWKCKHEMPDGLRYCGNCGVRMNRVAYVFEWLISKRGLPVLLLILALIIGCAAWGIVAKLSVPKIDLDMGWYTPGDENIVYKDEHESYGYVNNMILIFFTKDATPEQINEVIESVDGEVVGVMAGVNQYQVQVKTQTEEELEQMRKDLLQFEVVKNAVVDYVTTVEGGTAAIPNDPWDGTNSGWDEANPGGANWWVEAAHIVSAWDYESYFSHADVGIVDNGYDTTHEDLEMVILNSDVANSEDHGTHVAGIIGATANNGVGISGVLRDVTMYCVDCYATEDQSAQKVAVSSLLAGIDTCLYNGCRVVNMSSGLIYTYAAGNSAGVVQTARQAVTYLVMMIDAYDEDFIVVQSAGNGDSNGNGVDALRYNGYFASIDRQLVQQVLEEMEADGAKLEKNITVDDVMNSLMIVGAVDMERSGNGDYQLSEFSNYGEAVTVCAPGVAVLSTVPTGNQYAYFDGTSMAAPVVAGVTAMVWSVDPTMSAGEVKDIVVSTATEPVAARTSGDYGIYYMVNASAAVEKAIGILEAKATEPGETEEPTAPSETSEPTVPTEPGETSDPADGKRLDRISCYDGGELKSEYVFTYDSKGDLQQISELTYGGGTYDSVVIANFTLNELGNLTKVEIPPTEVTPVTITNEYFYDSDNRLVKYVYTESASYTTTYQYDAEGNLSTKISQQPTWEEHTAYTYEDGLLVSELTILYYEDDVQEPWIRNVTYTYDGQGNLTKTVTSDDNGAVVAEYVHGYQLFTGVKESDEAGNSWYTLEMSDECGNFMWALYLSSAEFTADSNGYITTATDNQDNYIFEFSYSGTDDSYSDSTVDYTFGYAGQTWDATMGNSGYTGFYTDDQLIATVDDNGVVTARAAGTTQIHAKLNGERFTWTVRVNTVPFKDEAYYRVLSLLAGMTSYQDTFPTYSADKVRELYENYNGSQISGSLSNAEVEIIRRSWCDEVLISYYRNGQLAYEESYYFLIPGQRSISGYAYSPFIGDDRENEVRMMHWYDEDFFCFPACNEYDDFNGVISNYEDYQFVFFDAYKPDDYIFRVIRIG